MHIYRRILVMVALVAAVALIGLLYMRDASESSRALQQTDCLNDYEIRPDCP